MMELTPELLEVAKRFSAPVVIVNVYFDGVQLPARVRRTSKDGRIVLEITAQLEPHLHLYPDRFEIVTESERLVVPWGAVECLMDRKSGETFNTNPDNGKALH
jgi:stringent starvation protein B